MMFDNKFTEKVDISSSQFRKVFYHLCQNAKKMPSNVKIDPTILPNKIKQLEESKRSTPSWIKKRVDETLAKRQEELKELKKHLSSVKRTLTSLKKKKGIRKKLIKEFEERLKGLKKLIDKKKS